MTRPAHATAIGKILLAYMPPADRDKLVASLPMTPITPHTIRDRDQLLQELVQALEEGVAHDRCEFDADVRCIAMPVRDFTGRCVAAIDISSPVWRMTQGAIESKSGVLANAARELSQALGYRERVTAEQSLPA